MCLLPIRERAVDDRELREEEGRGGEGGEQKEKGGAKEEGEDTFGFLFPVRVVE